MQPGYTILDHPSDLGIEARGRTLAEAFEQAAIGLMSIIVDCSFVERSVSRQVTLVASGSDQLLVKWLSEILYLYDGKHFVCSEFIVSNLRETALTATVSGEMLDPKKHTTKLDVKAITYHQLSVREESKEVVVQVFLDI